MAMSWLSVRGIIINYTMEQVSIWEWLLYYNSTLLMVFIEFPVTMRALLLFLLPWAVVIIEHGEIAQVMMLRVEQVFKCIPLV